MRTLALAALLLLGGCSSIYNLVGGTERGPMVFGGVKTWPEDVTDLIPTSSHQGACDGSKYIFCVILEGLIDLPCSLAADILLLPVTIPFELFRD